MTSATHTEHGNREVARVSEIMHTVVGSGSSATCTPSGNGCSGAVGAAPYTTVRS